MKIWNDPNISKYITDRIQSDDERDLANTPAQQSTTSSISFCVPKEDKQIASTTKYARSLTYTPQRTHPYVYVRCNGLLMPPLIRQLTDKFDEYYTRFYVVPKL